VRNAQQRDAEQKELKFIPVRKIHQPVLPRATLAGRVTSTPTGWAASVPAGWAASAPAGWAASVPAERTIAIKTPVPEKSPLCCEHLFSEDHIKDSRCNTCQKFTRCLKWTFIPGECAHCPKSMVLRGSICQECLHRKTLAIPYIRDAAPSLLSPLISIIISYDLPCAPVTEHFH